MKMITIITINDCPITIIYIHYLTINYDPLKKSRKYHTTKKWLIQDTLYYNIPHHLLIFSPFQPPFPTEVGLSPCHSQRSHVAQHVEVAALQTVHVARGLSRQVIRGVAGEILDDLGALVVKHGGKHWEKIGENMGKYRENGKTWEDTWKIWDFWFKCVWSGLFHFSNHSRGSFGCPLH